MSANVLSRAWRAGVVALAALAMLAMASTGAEARQYTTAIFTAESGESFKAGCMDLLQSGIDWSRSLEAMKADAMGAALAHCFAAGFTSCRPVFVSLRSSPTAIPTCSAQAIVRGSR